MLVLFVGQVLGSSERDTRGDNALDRRIVREVEEEGDTLKSAVLLEVLFGWIGVDGRKPTG